MEQLQAYLSTLLVTSFTYLSATIVQAKASYALQRLISINELLIAPQLFISP